MKKYFLYFIVFLIAANLKAQETELFDQATQFYADGDYQAAIENYQEILNQGKTSTEVYFNLANAYYKLDQIGPSIYYYNKALQLSPNNEDVQNNLAFAQEKTIDLIEENPKTGWSKFIDDLISTFYYETCAKIAVGFSILLMCFGIAYYFSKRSCMKRFFFGLSGLSLILGVLSVIFAFQQFDIQQSKTFAIVFSKVATVHAEPNPNSMEAFTLHEGTKVKVLDNFNGYAQIKLTDDSRGWIKEGAIKSL